MKNLALSLLCTLAASLALVAAPVVGQEPTMITALPATPPPPAFSYAFGTMPTGAIGQSCSVVATAPKGSAAKGQQIKFVLDSTPANAVGKAWQYFLISTGRSKTLAQVQAMFAEAFARAPSTQPGTELCLLGDIKYGGEVRVVSRGGGAVELAYNPPLTIGNPVLTPGETAAFARILAP